MNALERRVYDLVKRFPALKDALVDAYQRALYLWPVADQQPYGRLLIRPGHFYGFHDKCPWSKDQSKLLAHQTRIGNRMPGATDVVGIGYFVGDDYMEFRTIGESRAWNWQKGAMLQWVGDSDRIIFNDYDGGSVVARILDVNGRLISVLPRGIAALTHDGRWALSYSFERMKRGAPAYAYANGSDPEEAEPLSQKDGLYLLEMGSGTVQQLFTIADIAAVDAAPTMVGAYHYFTHCLFSPSAERFVFFHRWIKGRRMWTRMITCDRRGQNLHIFRTSGTVTHICWRDDDHILAYASTVEHGDRYYLFEDRSENYELVAVDFFRADGHPQFSPDGRWLLTDTYPNRSRMQSLLMYDTIEKAGRVLATFRIPLKYRYEVRCDFHPRWSRDGRCICFDSAHSGRRSLCTLRWTA